ncbi:EAL domain-containing protein [Iodobacter sp. HSC-16F04]|uniref:EAL domain-containing protein n=1 Tax=Iodobacter violaceini TaxID=3044271 RepID=A0ABX0KUC1_9NEIS|nr:EAL domain-containing protein [Iodobacter violacea]NHQ87384.1 EAL domain-containing protein [Iodobacter violacea]
MANIATILNICSDPVQLRQSSQLLNLGGYKVLTADSKEMALQLCHHAIDAIMISGLSSTKTPLCCTFQSKLNTQNIPLLLLHQKHPPCQLCMARSRTAALSWPCDLASLMDALGQLINQQTPAAEHTSLPRQAAFFDHSNDLICTLNNKGQLDYLNQAGCKLLGLKPNEASGKMLSDFMPADAQAAFAESTLPQTLKKGISSQEGSINDTFGNQYPLWQTLINQPEYSPFSIMLFARDISHQKHTEHELQQQKLFYAALEALSLAIMISDSKDKNHPVVYVNKAFSAITGYSAKDLLGQNGRILLRNKLDQPELEILRRTLRNRACGHFVLECFRKDGARYANEVFVSPLLDQQGEATHYISIFHDVSERQRQELQLAQLATHDPLTGLANRALLNDRLARAITHSQRYNSIAAILLIDLDRFKKVNDSLGHAIGDILLKLVASRLESMMRAGDTIARMGGDEFAIVSELVNQEDAATVARKVQQMLSTPFHIGKTELFITPSIGISFAPMDGANADSLLRRADVALYQVKENGRNHFRFFSPEMNQRASHILEMESALRNALHNNEFQLYYQPQIDLYSGELIGAEALIRWQHPEMGQIQPSQFIPFAEESGIIIPIGEWVLNEACIQAKKWQTQLSIPVAVNLSALQFRQENIVEIITKALKNANLEGRWLELELTESVVVQNLDAAIIYLKQLKQLGISLAMDDFGTGYSSLGYLKQFPFNTLKIDRSFIQNVTTEPNDALIAIAIISMAHSLRLNVVAEGVETESQLNFLHRQNCDLIQGYYYSKPLPADEFDAFIANVKKQPFKNKIREQNSRTLLIVDDEPDILNALKRLFRRSGYQIFTSTSALDALELLALNSIHVIISDQRMPQMHGSEFLRRVRELYPDTVRIMLTGYTELNALTNAINSAGIYKFITKPWEDEDLLEEVRHAFAYYEQTIKHKQGSF